MVVGGILVETILKMQWASTPPKCRHAPSSRTAQLISTFYKNWSHNFTSWWPVFLCNLDSSIPPAGIHMNPHNTHLTGHAETICTKISGSVPNFLFITFEFWEH
jgi:hypothetical protein